VFLTLEDSGRFGDSNPLALGVLRVLGGSFSTVGSAV
jgi:hypothetical protein